MKNPIGRLTSFLTGAGLVLCSGGVWADDTEVYFNTQQASIRPNLLFILDNSGSMDALVEVENEPFNPNESYSGSFNPTSIYFQYSDRWGRTYNKEIERSNLQCSDMDSRIDAAGKLLNYKAAYYESGPWWSSWKGMSSNYNGEKVDCEADNDITMNWRYVDRKDYYSGNYANWYTGTRSVVKMTRLEIMQDVAKKLADSVTGVNIGLMVFNTDGYKDEGGRLVNPVKNVDDNREDFKRAVDALDHETYTPLSETLFEAMRYFAGESPFLDDDPRSFAVDANDKYRSPIELECQSNNIVVLTDGEPTRDANHSSNIGSVVGSCSGNCLDEIAGHMKDNDISSAYSGTQSVTTHTVGFNLDQQFLKDAADAGGGNYYTADSAEELTNAFEDIVREVMDTSSTFVSPGVAVNTFNRLGHLDSLYYTVFSPSKKTLWDGNLKRYKLTSGGEIRDVNDDPAIDSNTGFFSNDAVSWWTPSGDPDGRNVAKGGARQKLPDVVANRKVFTWLSGNDLTTAGNALDVTNTGVTKALLGDSGMSDSDRSSLIQWIRGKDVTDSDDDGDREESRKFIGDPLHSEPKLLIYGGTKAAPDTTVFFGDNQGFFHAIDGETGESYFSFMPTELLGRQAGFMSEEEFVDVRPYGIDGSVVTWVENETDDIDSSDGDHAYAYFGMRRGGRNYYALDVTNRNKPKALWKIIGGTGDFAELGQSWAKPVKAKVKIGNSEKDVLIISGGYDEDQDSASQRTEDDVGRAIYIVDAKTGDRLWWAGPKGSSANLELESLKYSIPAMPWVYDLSGDEYIDQLYVGDMGGQIFRIDFNNGEVLDDFATGSVIANLAGDTPDSARRFYHTPDVSVLKYWGQRYLSIAIGSGWHAHPLNKTIVDRFYMLRVPFSKVGAPVDASGDVDYGAVLTEADLFDAYSNVIGNGTEKEQKTAEIDLTGKQGWFFAFDNPGEKVMASSLTVDGAIYFTSYEPAATQSACRPSVGTARYYIVGQRDAKPLRNIPGVHHDRWSELPLGDPPSEPVRPRIEDGDYVCVGLHCEAPLSSDSFKQYFWREGEVE